MADVGDGCGGDRGAHQRHHRLPTPVHPLPSSELLRARRLAAGLTQRELGARVGVTQARLSGLERGRLVIRSPVVRELIELIDQALEDEALARSPARSPGAS